MSAPVLLVSNFLPAKGTTRLMEDFKNALERRGRKVFFTSTVTAKPARLLDMIHSIWKWKREYRLAVVSLFSGQAFVWAEASCAALGLAQKKFIVHLHGGNLPAFAARHPKRVSRLLRKASCVVAPSAYLQRALETHAGPRGIRVIPNGFAASEYAFKPRARFQPELCWVRAFHRIYNPVLAVRVLAGLSKRYPQARLRMLGPDKKDGSLEETREAAKTLGVEGRVEILQAVDHAEIPGWLSKSDIFLNTASIDNMPLSVIEAMACGLCVVSTDAGGMRFLVEDGAEGLLAPVGDAERMQDAVVRALENPGLAAKLTGNARKKIESFDWSRVMDSWEKLLSENSEDA
ncbi:MAG TPA: glycosyltransferase family 4 protein [Verrucomicrobiae bacterium]|nr:glycosyltransferase family 4 protein [Verrucomicrobiae bacterium]